jgi:hypothetical protein
VIRRRRRPRGKYAFNPTRSQKKLIDELQVIDTKIVHTQMSPEQDHVVSVSDPDHSDISYSEAERLSYSDAESIGMEGLTSEFLRFYEQRSVILDF